MKGKEHEQDPKRWGEDVQENKTEASTMIADLNPYPEYRAAEGHWLGKVPSHWRIRRFKYLLSETDSRSTSGKEQLLRVSQYTGVTQRRRVDGGDEPDTRAESLVGYKRVEKSQLVVNIMLAWNGSLGVSSYAGIASPAYCVYQFNNEAHPWYYHHLLRSPVYKTRIKTLSTGVVESRLRLYTDSFFRIEGLLPPPTEQAAIVRFLDWANGRLERAIRAKRKVIALLHEQKQAIIHKAVTQGLDPNVPKRDSGIPWLGEIPAHWVVAKFKHFFHVRMGQTFLKPDLSETGELPVLSATMSGAVLGYTVKSKARTLLKEGDLVIPARGNSIGYVALVTKMCTSSQTTIQAIRIPNQRLSTRFAHLFSIGNKPFLYSFVQTAIPQITTHEVASNLVLLPPMDEQIEICVTIDAQCSGLNTAIARYEREITLLREYRTRLVADVVTGKLDVREAAQSLPEEEVVLASEGVEDEAEEPEMEELEG